MVQEQECIVKGIKFIFFYANRTKPVSGVNTSILMPFSVLRFWQGFMRASAALNTLNFEEWLKNLLCQKVRVRSDELYQWCIGKAVAGIVINGPTMRAAGARRLTFAARLPPAAARPRSPRPAPPRLRTVPPRTPAAHASEAFAARYKSSRWREWPLLTNCIFKTGAHLLYNTMCKSTCYPHGWNVAHGIINQVSSAL